jgi:hypothetical protein
VRAHRVIRYEKTTGQNAFSFDIETNQFKNLMITWDNTDSPFASVTGVVLCPTIVKPVPLSANANFTGSGILNPPAQGSISIIGIGPGCEIPVPLPDVITVGVINQGTSTRVSIKVEGDEVDDLPPYEPGQRARS